MVNLVIVESPFAPKQKDPAKAAVELARNKAYVAAAMHDCFMRGEVPFASHAIYTLPGVLDDTIPEQREQGIQAGFRVAEVFQIAANALHFTFGFKRVFYEDRDWSRGMMLGLEDAKRYSQKHETRSIGEQWAKDQDQHYALTDNGVLYDAR
jgi:hypothetical protein